MFSNKPRAVSFWNRTPAADTSTPLRAAITAEREARSVAVSTEDPDPRLFAMLGLGGGPLSGIAVTERTALGFAAVWACVLAISQDIAALPCQLFEDTDNGGKVKISGHPALRLLNLQASPLQNSMPHRQAMIATVLLHGNAYARIEYGPRYRPVALHYKHPHNTEVIPDNGRLYYRFAGDATMYQDYEVIHLRGLCLDERGIMGTSVLSAHRENIGQGLAALKGGTAFYNNGARISGALETDSIFKDAATAGRIRADWQSIYGGAENAGKVAVLEGGMKFKAISLPPADAQFLETRKFTRGEIASIFRVPPHKIGDLERSTNNNIEQQGIDYVQNTLTPWLVNIEQEYRLKLLTAREVDTHYFRHNLTALMRADVAGRGSYYRTMTDIGVYSINDVLALEEMNGIGPEGNARFVQVNRQTLENAILGPPAAITPDSTPAP